MALSQVVWICFGSTGTTSPRNGPTRSGMEKNAKYGQMYSICGMFIVAVCADLSPIDVSFFEFGMHCEDLPRTTLPFQTTKPAKRAKIIAYGIAILITSKGLLRAATTTDATKMMTSINH